MIKIGKEDILIFIVAFFTAFIIFKNTPSIEYPVLHINPYQKPKTQNQYKENVISKTLYAPKYLFVKNLFNLPPPPPPTLPPLAQAIFVSNTVKLSGIFERGNVRFAVLSLPNGSVIKVRQGQLIPADIGGGPQGPAQPGGGMPGLPSLPQLLGVHPPPFSPPLAPNAKMSTIPKNKKGPFVRVLAVGPNYVSFSFVQKIPKQEGALTTYKYKFYKKTIRIFNFEVKNYER
ncbi:hypothetical protein [Hydrogenobaculum acidophilum]